MPWPIFIHCSLCISCVLAQSLALHRVHSWFYRIESSDIQSNILYCSLHVSCVLAQSLVLHSVHSLFYRIESSYDQSNVLHCLLYVFAHWFNNWICIAFIVCSTELNLPMSNRASFAVFFAFSHIGSIIGSMQRS